MPITTTVQITIILAEATNVAIPESRFAWRYLPSEGNFKLVESRLAGNVFFELIATADMAAAEGSKDWQALLSADESDHLRTLLDNMPAYSMSAQDLSIDGRQYELILAGKGSPLIFYWQNNDWQSDSNNPEEAWEQVVSVAHKILALVEKHRPARMPVCHELQLILERLAAAEPIKSQIEISGDVADKAKTIDRLCGLAGGNGR